MSCSNLKKSPLDYIHHLNTQAKIKRMQSAMLHSETADREKNFQLFFSGANEIRAKKKNQHNQENSKSPYIRKVPNSTTQVRKRWGTPSTPSMLKDSNSNFQTPETSPLRSSPHTNLLKRFESLPVHKKLILLEKLKELEESV